ncbi:MAG: tail fiber protein [Planctomycetes bacterium]|nr:tail fiber protein [Planctomycetota bacterium]
MAPTPDQTLKHQARSTIPIWDGKPIACATGPSLAPPGRARPDRRCTRTLPIGQVFTGAAGAAGPAGPGLPAGTIVDFAGVAVPAGWLECDGSIVGQLAYAALHAAIGDAYNREGEDELEFRLPNFCGRVAVGVGMDADERQWPLAEEGGEKDHTLIAAELPAHVHGKGLNGSGSPEAAIGSAVLQTGDTESVGNDTPHNNLQPYLVVLKIIKT